jgi:hypothetical protein
VVVIGIISRFGMVGVFDRFSKHIFANICLTFCFDCGIMLVDEAEEEIIMVAKQYRETINAKGMDIRCDERRSR